MTAGLALAALVAAALAYWLWPSTTLRQAARTPPHPTAQRDAAIRPVRPAVAVPTVPERRPTPASVPQPAALHPPQIAVPAPTAKVPPPQGEGARIAIVIDDVGPAVAHSERAVRLPAAITLSILPYAPEAARLARQARAGGHEILVHMPMEPLGRADPGPNALKVGLDPAEFARRLDWNLTRFGGYVGVNNHMGSRLTADAAAMRTVLAALRRRGVLFLDSRTDRRSVAARVAAAVGVPTLTRNVFLDDTMTADNVRRQLAATEAYARRHGAAIAIGHPHPVTLDVLEPWARDAARRGFVLVPLTALLPRAPLVARREEGSGDCRGTQQGTDALGPGACAAQRIEAAGTVALGQPPPGGVAHQPVVVPGGHR